MLDRKTAQAAPASLRTLTGSSQPGTVPPFAPLATATAPGTTAPLAAGHPDAELVEFAIRVDRLAQRDEALWERRSTLEDRVMREAGNAPLRPETPCRSRMTREVTPTEDIIIHAVDRNADAADAEFLAPWRVAVEAHERAKEELEQRLGLPLLAKRIERSGNRLFRWTAQLADMEPRTRAGLAAKAAAVVSLGNRVGSALDEAECHLVLSLARDTVRLARAPRESPVDADLLRAVEAWRVSARKVDAAYETRDAASNLIRLPEVPDALRFRAETDATFIGAHQNVHPPHGYTDMGQIDRLRRGVAAVHQARADEIIAAFDAWQAARRATEDACGYTAACEAHDAACAENRALRLRILALPAQGLDGLRAKAEVAVWCSGDERAMQENLNRLLAGGDATDEAFAAGLMLDVTRVLGPAQEVLPSDLRPAPLPADYPMPRYPAAVSPAVVEGYRTFLEMELRFLNHEVYGPVEGRLHYWLNNPAGAFHNGDESAPSTRAAAVLSLLGLMPIGAEPARDARQSASAA